MPFPSHSYHWQCFSWRRLGHCFRLTSHEKCNPFSDVRRTCHPRVSFRSRDQMSVRPPEPHNLFQVVENILDKYLVLVSQNPSDGISNSSATRSCLSAMRRPANSPSFERKSTQSIRTLISCAKRMTKEEIKWPITWLTRKKETLQSTDSCKTNTPIDCFRDTDHVTIFFFTFI